MVIFKTNGKNADKGFKLAYWTVPKGIDVCRLLFIFHTSVLCIVSYVISGHIIGLTIFTASHTNMRHMDVSFTNDMA